MIRVIRRALEFQLIVSTIREPGAEISSRQPAAPTYLQHLTEIKGINRHHDEKSGQDAEDAQLAKELAAIQFLKRIVERVVPFIDAHADIDVAEVERNDGEKKSPGGPFLLRFPVGFGKPPRVAHRVPL